MKKFRCHDGLYLAIAPCAECDRNQPEATLVPSAARIPLQARNSEAAFPKADLRVCTISQGDAAPRSKASEAQKANFAKLASLPIAEVSIFRCDGKQRKILGDSASPLAAVQKEQRPLVHSTAKPYKAIGGERTKAPFGSG